MGIMKKIKEEIKGLKKDAIHILDPEKLDIDNIEPMRQETHKPGYITPIAISGVRNSPRMKYRK